jgi:hypothetical protein
VRGERPELAQEALLLAVLARHIFADDGISGAEFERRAGLMALMAALKPRPPFRHSS